MDSEQFESLANALAATGALSSPAELHGYVAGSCCAADMPDSVALCQQLAGHMDISPEQLASVIDLAEWITQIEAGLASPELGFYPLLPDDDEDIVHRTAALGQWCQGFLAGFALKLGAAGQTPSAETQEVLSDLVAIARIGAPEGSDEDEADFMELVEYLRMAAMNLFLEARDPHPKTDPDTPSVH